jgi:predicted lipid-binding transport protein (Tim44 family)
VENSQILGILLIAMVAGIILFRLYAVLGRRTGNEREPPKRYPQLDGQGGNNVVALPDRAAPRLDSAAEKPSDPVAQGLLDIQLADRSFEAEHFIAGAKHAYELIVVAFAANDRAALKPLLNDEVYAAFDGVIHGREERREKVNFTLIEIDNAKISHAEMKGRMAEVTVEFSARFNSATLNAEGAVIDGDPKSVREVVDIWTFARDTRSNDPNWALVATTGVA